MRVGPTPREDRDIGRMPCNARGKNWSDAAASQEMPRAPPSALPSEARKKEGFPLQISEEAHPSGISIFHF